MQIKTVANSYLVAALFLGALLPIMLDMTSGMSLYEFLFLAYLVSLPVSAAFVLVSGKAGKLSKYLRSGRDLPLLAFIGLLNYAFLEFGLSYAERFVTVPFATVMYRTYPILMLLFIPFMLKERISRYQIAALALACIGLFIGFSGGTLQPFSESNPGIIAFLVVIAMAGALATVLIKKYAYDMESSMFIFNLANFCLFVALFAASGFRLALPTYSELVPILYVGAVYNVFVGFMYYGALRVLKTTVVTNIYFLSPFITMLFAYLLLGQGIAPYYVAIALLVAVGMLIQKLDKVGGTYSGSRASARSFVMFDVTGAFVDSGEVGINSAIRNGGRVLATKLDTRYKGHVGALVKSGYGNVFTSDMLAEHESNFVRDITGAGEGEMAVVAAGDADAGERFFSELSDSIRREGEPDLTR